MWNPFRSREPKQTLVEVEIAIKNILGYDPVEKGRIPDEDLLKVKHLVRLRDDLLFKSFEERQCPDCHGKNFIMGPHGGMSQNIECSSCGSNFNVGPFDDGVFLGSVFMVDRIGWNISGRWAEKGRLKEEKSA